MAQVDRSDLLDRHGPVFLLGCPDSGLGQIQQILAPHPMIEPLGGWVAPPRLFHGIARATGEAERQQLTLILRDILWRSLFKRVAFRVDRLLELYQGHQPPGYFLGKPELDGRLLLFYEPFAAFAARALVEAFPRARFIYAVREPGAVARQLTRSHADFLDQAVLDDPMLRHYKVSAVGFAEPGPDGRHVPWWVEEADRAAFAAADAPVRCLYLWQAMVGHCRALAEVAGPERVIELRHETLVADPEAAARTLVERLGLAWSDRLRRGIKKAAATKSAPPPTSAGDKLDEEARRICGPTGPGESGSGGARRRDGVVVCAGRRGVARACDRYGVDGVGPERGQPVARGADCGGYGRLDRGRECRSV